MKRNFVYFAQRLVALCAIVVLSSAATQAAVLSSWSFEAPSTPADLSNSATGPTVTNDGGVNAGSLVGVHASTATDWTTPVGNGSVDSYSVNDWAIGDYFQFTTNSLGFDDIAVAVDHTSSPTGPRDFSLQYSTDGTTYTPFADYSVLANTAPDNWNSGTRLPIHTYTFDLSSVSALDNQAILSFRLAMRTTVSANGTTVAAGGTSRVDNVTVLPEPSSLACVALGLLVIGLRKFGC